MKTNKITAEIVQEWESDSLIDALGNCLELNDEFLARYCSEEFREIISKVPERDREYVLSGLTEKHWFNGSPAGNNDQDIWLNVDEIECQFEGNPGDVFENPSDFTIHGDLAYLYIGYGLSIEYDREELNQAIASYLEI